MASVKKTKIQIERLFKIFGDTPERAFELIERNLSKDEIFEHTGNTIGLHDVNLEIREGEVFVVMGLSGSGKSTLLRCVNRLIPSTSGRILLEGTDINLLDEEELRQVRRERLAMVFQNFALLPHRNVIDNVAFGLEIQDIEVEERHARAQEVLDTVGLGGHSESRISQLSGGMKQRVGLARALTTDADILLMDEAFSALDPLIRTNMQDELLNLQKTIQKTIIFISHDLDEALHLGDRIAIMKDGKVSQVGTKYDILMNPADDYVSQFVEKVDREKWLDNGSNGGSE